MAVPLPDFEEEGSRLVRRLQELYPSPCAHDRRGAAAPHYCVGGALLLYLTDDYPAELLRRHGLLLSRLVRRFPTRVHLARALRLANPGLQYDGEELRGDGPAMVYAYRIIKANDRGAFGKAWALLAEALTYGREDPA